MAIKNTSEASHWSDPSPDIKTLENKILASLAHRLGGQVQDARLLVRDQFLVLQGRARSYYVKQIAQQVVLEEVADHQSLINEIEVY